MRTVYDQLGKGLLRDTLTLGGDMHPEHEVTSAPQAIDGWFQPDPARTERLRRRGMLGRMARGDPALFEPFHDPPGVDDVRGCIHKQLAIDRSRRREARRARAERPPFPRLWLISAGRPRDALQAYGFRRVPGWPAGFWQRSQADALFLVVVRDLPPTRATLILRLMGARSVLRRAIADLQRLPEGAWERDIAIPLLVAARFELSQDGSDDDAREFLMSTQTLYEQWAQTLTEQSRSEGLRRGLAQGLKKGRQEGLKKGRLEGRQDGLRQALLTVYRARFGAVPVEVASVIEGTREIARLERWLEQIGAGSADDFAAALRA